MTETNGAMRLFELDGSSLYLHSGDTIKTDIAKDVVLSKNPHLSYDRLNKMIYAAYWIMEGELGAYDLDSDKYPAINDYLKKREGMTLLERWDLYMECAFTAGELELLRLAHEGTRGHVLEVMADTPLDEKKTG